MEDCNFILDDRLDWTNAIGQNFGDGELHMTFDPRTFRPRCGRDTGSNEGQRREVLIGNACTLNACEAAASESTDDVIRCDGVGLKGRDDDECVVHNKSEGGQSCLESAQ